MVKKYLMLIGCVALLSACATGEPVKKSASDYKSELNATAVMADENTAVLNIARFGTTGYALKARIHVDGKEVGRLANKEYLSVPLRPGPHKIKLKFNTLSFQKGDAIEMTAEAGKVYSYRITSATSGFVGGSAGNNISTDFRIVSTAPETVIACCVKIEPR